MDSHGEHLRVVGDVTAASVTVATVASWLPSIAAIFTIVWTALRIYEWFVSRKGTQKESD